MVLITYVFECVDYKILFNIEAPAGKQHGEKVLLSDVTIPVGKCAANFAFKVKEILNICIRFGERLILARSAPKLIAMFFILDLGLFDSCCVFVVMETFCSGISSLSVLGYKIVLQSSTKN